MPDHSRLQPVHHLTVDDSEGLALAPMVTYGKPKKLLSLSGAHFKQATTPIPEPWHQNSDEVSEEVKTSNTLDNASHPIREPSPNDSPLSEDCLERLYGSHASPIRRSSGSLSGKEVSIRQSPEKCLKSLIARPLSRRLPVNELLLVTGQQHDEFHSYDPPSSFHGTETQDPIAETSSPRPLKRRNLATTTEVRILRSRCLSKPAYRLYAIPFITI